MIGGCLEAGEGAAHLDGVAREVGGDLVDRVGAIEEDEERIGERAGVERELDRAEEEIELDGAGAVEREIDAECRDVVGATEVLDVAGGVAEGVELGGAAGGGLRVHLVVDLRRGRGGFVAGLGGAGDGPEVGDIAAGEDDAWTDGDGQEFEVGERAELAGDTVVNRDGGDGEARSVERELQRVEVHGGCGRDLSERRDRRERRSNEPDRTQSPADRQPVTPVQLDVFMRVLLRIHAELRAAEVDGPSRHPRTDSQQRTCGLVYLNIAVKSMAEREKTCKNGNPLPMRRPRRE